MLLYKSNELIIRLELHKDVKRNEKRFLDNIQTSIKTCNVKDRDTTPSYQNRSSRCFASYILQSNWHDYLACSRLVHAYYCLFDDTSNTSNRELTLQARELTFEIPIIYKLYI